MSAITGICECWAISGSASASSCEGQATRTMSQPAAVSSAICCSVVFTSAVSVVVIDCTEIGWSLPTPTLPTWICRVWRRGASTGGGAAGMPRGTEVMGPRLRPGRAPTPGGRPQRGRWSDLDRGDDVGEDEHDADQDDHHGHRVARPAAASPTSTGPGQGGRAAARARGGPPRRGVVAMPAPSNGGSGTRLIRPRKRFSPPSRSSSEKNLLGHAPPVGGGDLAGDPAGADHAHRAVGVALLQPERGPADVVDLLRHRRDRPRASARCRRTIVETT